jgi:hypothetical protein
VQIVRVCRSTELPDQTHRRLQGGISIGFRPRLPFALSFPTRRPSSHRRGLRSCSIADKMASTGTVCRTLDKSRCSAEGRQPCANSRRMHRSKRRILIRSPPRGPVFIRTLSAGAARWLSVSFPSLGTCSTVRPRNCTYSITSLARNRIDWGMASPSAFAVLRLMRSSNLVGCSTGRSAGLAPFNILSA